jgi:catechol 2,3-dioxygenase-like lactoylglutathione lyase family enzyme
MEPGIAIPILPARDLTETRHFYERLGFTATGWWPDTFGGYAILVRGDLTMHFFGYPASVDTSKPATTWTGKTGHHRDSGRDSLVFTS